MTATHVGPTVISISHMHYVITRWNVDRASVPRTVTMCLFANIVFRKET